MEMNVRRANFEMKNWCDQNKLVLNETNLIQFRSNEHVQLIANSDFQNVNSTNFLGINIDQFLRWNVHYEELIKKASKAVYGIRRLKAMTDIETAKLAYFGMFYSLITYGTLIWGNSTVTIDVFKLQKKRYEPFSIYPKHIAVEIFSKISIL